MSQDIDPYYVVFTCLPETCLIRCPQSDLPNINWKKINEDSVQAYKQALQGSQALNNITESVLLSNTHIDQAYSTLVLEVKKIAKSCFPEKKFKRFLKPYWNCDLQNLHTNMKLKRATWLTELRQTSKSYEYVLSRV